MFTRSTFRAFAVLSILVVVGYAVFYLFSISGSTATIKLTEDEPCRTEGGKCRSSCLINEYYDGECFTGEVCCKGKSINLERDRYYYNLAMKDKNLSTCNKISNDDDAAECKLLLLDMSYRDFAQKYNDMSYCDKISSEMTKAGCITDFAISTASPSLCLRIKEKSRAEMCYKNYATAAKDSTICTNEITDSTLKDICYKSVAVELKDSSRCGAVEDMKFFNDCIVDAEARRIVNYTDCNTLDENSCIKVAACKPFYVEPRCPGCPAVEFESCTFDTKEICESSYGKWYGGICRCPINEAFFGNYGCIECDAFFHSKVKELCELGLTN